MSHLMTALFSLLRKAHHPSIRCGMLYIALAALCSASSPATRAAQLDCPWLVREISLPDGIAHSARIRPGERAFSVTYFGGGRKTSAFYGFGVDAEQRSNAALPDFATLAGANAQALRCTLVEDDGVEHAYCTFASEQGGTSTLYFVAAAGRIAELEKISTRIDPVRLNIRGPSNFSGRLPRQLVPIQSLVGFHEASASSFQVCAFHLE